MDYRSYGALLSELGVGAGTREYALSIYPHPKPSWETPPISWGFPPALIPLWSDADLFVYQGVWKHWFSNRTLTFVEVESEDGPTATEVARDERQLACRILQFRFSIDRKVTDASRSFAERIGIAEYLDDLLAISLKTDDPRHLLTLPPFAERPPASLMTSGGMYSGEFPLGTPPGLLNCAVEFEKVALAEARLVRPLPPWLDALDQRSVFEQMVRDGNLAAAWMALNSRDWAFSDAVAALQRLSRETADPTFHLMTKVWVEFNGPEELSY